MKIRLVTVIWGTPFVDLFLRVCVRSLMAEGNLPELVRRHQCTYTLYTTAADFQRIEASPEFARLRELVKVEVSLFGIGEIDGSNRGSHAVLWSRGLELAKRNREILFLIIPDLLYGEQTLSRWAQCFEQGWRAVYTPGPFVALETALPEIEQQFLGSDKVISVSRESLLPFLLQHLHPAECGMFRDAPRRSLHPEHDLRPVKGRGFVMRAFTSQPFCIDPNHFLKITHFNVEDHLDDICFEPFSTISLEPVLKTLEWLYRPNFLDETRLSRLGAWWAYFSLKGSIAESGHIYDFVLPGGNSETDNARARAVAGGSFFRTQMYAGLHIYRYWEWITHAGEFWPAVFLATAHFSARLRRKFIFRNESVIFVPRSPAFERAPNSWVWDCLKPGREKDLIALIRAHVFTKVTEADGTVRWVSGCGEDLETAGNRARIDGGPYQVNGQTIYFVDDIMVGPPQLGMDRHGQTFPVGDQFASDTLSENAEGPVADASDATPPEPRRGFRLPRRQTLVALIRWVLNRALQGLGSILRATTSVLAKLFRGIGWLIGRSLYPLVLIWRGMVRIAWILMRWLKGFRVCRTPIRGLERAQSIHASEGWPGIWLRFRSRYPHRAFVLERMAKRVGKLSEPARWWAGLARRGIVFAKRNGIRAAIMHGMTLFQQGGRVDFRRRFIRFIARKPNAKALRTLDGVRNLRCLMALEDVLVYYQNAALGSEMTSAPLELVCSRLKSVAGCNVDIADLLRVRLEQLGARYPRFAECWWELGIHLVDNAEPEAAKAAFEKCYSGLLFLPRQPGVSDCRALALEEAGRIYLAEGRFEEACQLFTRACKLEPAIGVFNLSRARAERRAGQENSAARNFFWAMAYRNLGYHVPSSVRDIAELEIDLAAQ